jgi:hypothetical protein
MACSSPAAHRVPLYARRIQPTCAVSTGPGYYTCATRRHQRQIAGCCGQERSGQERSGAMRCHAGPARSDGAEPARQSPHVLSLRAPGREAYSAAAVRMRRNLACDGRGLAPCFRRDTELAARGQGLPPRLLPPNFACGEDRSWHSGSLVRCELPNVSRKSLGRREHRYLLPMCSSPNRSPRSHGHCYRSPCL